MKKVAHYEIDQVGKTTQAHKAAARISLKKKKPNRLISMDEIVDLVFRH